MLIINTGIWPRVNNVVGSTLANSQIVGVHRQGHAALAEDGWAVGLSLIIFLEDLCRSCAYIYRHHQTPSNTCQCDPLKHHRDHRPRRSVYPRPARLAKKTATNLRDGEHHLSGGGERHLQYPRILAGDVLGQTHLAEDRRPKGATRDEHHDGRQLRCSMVFLVWQ